MLVHCCRWLIEVSVHDVAGFAVATGDGDRLLIVGCDRVSEFLIQPSCWGVVDLHSEADRVRELVVLTVSEARRTLPHIIAQLRGRSRQAEPVIIGSHRRPEAAVISYEDYENYREFVAMRQRRNAVENALAAVRIEGLEPNEEIKELAERFIDGHIQAADLTKAALALYQRDTPTM